MLYPAAAAYTAGLLGSYFSRRAGVYATRALAVGAATAGYKFGNWMKRRYNRSSNAKRSVAVRKASKRYAAGRSRARVARRSRASFAVGRKRSASLAFNAGAKRFVGVKRRRYGFVRSQNGEMGPAIKSVISVNRVRPIPRSILNLMSIRRILRWSGANSMSDASIGPPGFYRLSHQTYGTSTICPLHMFCLNNTYNNISVSQAPLKELSVTNTGNLTFIDRDGLNWTGSLTTTNSWNTEYTSMNSSFIGNRKILNAWYDVRMNCYGATAQPTVFDIMLVSLNYGYLDPIESPSNVQEAEDRKALYQGLVQPYMSNPILPMTQVKRRYRVHKRIRFTLDPTTTIENDADPKSRVVRLFIKDGASYDYCYHGDGITVTGADEALSTTNWANQGMSTADYSNYPMPRARKWLVIRAMNTTRTADAATETRANTPSYDLIVRKCEYAGTD